MAGTLEVRLDSRLSSTKLLLFPLPGSAGGLRRFPLKEGGGLESPLAGGGGGPLFPGGGPLLPGSGGGGPLLLGGGSFLASVGGGSFLVGGGGGSFLVGGGGGSFLAGGGGGPPDRPLPLPPLGAGGSGLLDGGALPGRLGGLETEDLKPQESERDITPAVETMSPRHVEHIPQQNQVNKIVCSCMCACV